VCRLPRRCEALRYTNRALSNSPSSMMLLMRRAIEDIDGRCDGTACMHSDSSWKSSRGAPLLVSLLSIVCPPVSILLCVYLCSVTILRMVLGSTPVSR
jgi:hypothetical protein